MWGYTGFKAVYTITIQDDRDRRPRAIRSAHNHHSTYQKGNNDLIDRVIDKNKLHA